MVQIGTASVAQTGCPFFFFRGGGGGGRRGRPVGSVGGDVVGGWGWGEGVCNAGRSAWIGYLYIILVQIDHTSLIQINFTIIIIYTSVFQISIISQIQAGYTNF